MALPQKNRLKKKRDFDAVFKKGKAVNGIFLFVKFRKSESGISRFGFVVSSKVAKKAVTRNRIRRILSSAVQPKSLSGNQTYDTVVVVTKNTDDGGLLRQDLLVALKKAHIL